MPEWWRAYDPRESFEMSQKPDQRSRAAERPDDVFISYSRNDREFALRLEKALESYSLPKGLGTARRNLRVFRDESDITGVEYYQSIERHLKGATKLVVVCSPSAASSDYVNDEIKRFAKLNDPKNIIPLLLSGIPNNEAGADPADQLAFPLALLEALKMPLATSYVGFDPLKDKVNKGRFSGAWFSLLANVYNVTRDEIEQREQKRRARRRFISTAVSLFIIVVLSIALVVTLLARNEAERRRLIAESGELANRALLRIENDSTAALMDAIESVQRAETANSLSVLRQAVYSAKVRMLLPHGGPTSAARYNNAGERIVTAGFDGKIKFWDAASGELLRTLDVGQEIRLLVFHPEDNLLAVANRGTIRLYDGDTLEQTQEFGEFSSTIQSIEFSSWGDMLIAAAGATAYYWDVATGEQLGRFSGSNIRMASMSLEGDKIVASYGDGHNAEVWDIQQRSGVNSIAYRGPVAESYFDPAAQWIGVRGEDSGAGVSRAGAEVRRSELQLLHRGKVNDIAFNRDGRFATAGEDGTVRIWSPVVGTSPTVSWQDLFVGTEHGGAVQIVAFSRSGKRLASVGRGGAIRIWEQKTQAGILSTETWGALTRFSVPFSDIHSVSFSPDGSHLVVAGESAPPVVFRVTEDRELFSLRIGGGNTYGAAFSPDGGRLLTRGSSQVPRLWDMSTGALIAALYATASGFEGGASIAMFTSNGRIITTAGNEIIFSDVETAKQLERKKLTGDGVFFIKAVTPDGSRALTSTFAGDEEVIWDVELGRQLLTLEGKSKCYFGPAGRLALVRTDAGVQTIVELASGRTIATMEPAQSNPANLSFNDSETLVVMTDKDSDLHLWDAQTGALVRTMDPSLVLGEEAAAVVLLNDDKVLLAGESGKLALVRDYHPDDLTLMDSDAPVRRAALSEDGLYLAIVDKDNCVSIWKTHTGTLHSTLPELTERVWDVQISPDASRFVVVTGSFVNVYVTRSGDLLDLAKSRLPLNLLQVE